MNVGDILIFEWDPNKNKANILKHRISFEDANIVRIISARKATKIEMDYYYGRVDL